ncbi:hypothetical protein GQ53DRAFT_885663 [Thozetella sp. PMI_491]|nr:hypothetical protein GQ53DRAFT_885663 [Thozetella sp. PMI_491]
MMNIHLVLSVIPMMVGVIIGLDNTFLAAVVGRADQVNCDCSDTPCPENNYSCIDGLCQCTHYTGCKASVDCALYHLSCPVGTIVNCGSGSAWPYGVCTCIPDPIGCDCTGVSCDEGIAGCDVNDQCTCFPVVGCKVGGEPPSDDFPVGCNEVLTHCPPGKVPACNENSQYARGVCYCKPV